MKNHKKNFDFRKEILQENTQKNTEFQNNITWTVRLNQKPNKSEPNRNGREKNENFDKKKLFEFFFFGLKTAQHLRWTIKIKWSFRIFTVQFAQFRGWPNWNSSLFAAQASKLLEIHSYFFAFSLPFQKAYTMSRSNFPRDDMKMC